MIHPTGPRNAKIMIVAEGPSRGDFLAGQMFIGQTGKEFTKMLHEVGILQTEVYLTSVCRKNVVGWDSKKYFSKYTPANQHPVIEVLEGLELLKQEICEVQPNLIIALGELSLWALTGQRGITKWRGSIMQVDIDPSPVPSTKVIPIYSPEVVARKYDWRFVAVQDLRRCEKESHFPEVKMPEYNFIIRPEFSIVMSTLEMLQNRAESIANDGGTVFGDSVCLDNQNNSAPHIRSNQSAPIKEGELNEQKTGNNLSRVEPNQEIHSQSAGVRSEATSGELRSEGQLNSTSRGTNTAGRTRQEDQRSLTEPARLILSGDIETRLGHITCFGIGWSKTDAICIPFTCVGSTKGYWSEEEELAIILRLKELFANENIGWIFQNGIYDYQYFAKHWGFVPELYMDTMLAHHTCWAGLPKGLDFQSSLYCEHHRYWKDEGKEFHKSIKTASDEDLYWVYNCKDCVTTQEIATILPKVIEDLGQQEPYAFQMRQFRPVLKMMLRGIYINRARKNELGMELLDALAVRENWMQTVIGRVLNPRSPKQMKEFFYDELGLPVQKDRKTKKPTTNAEALLNLAKKEPLIAPLVQCISEFRSIGVFLSTFVKAPLDTDGRMRCSYNIAGTETYRWSSSSDAFGTGMNLQNVPKGNEE